MPWTVLIHPNFEPEFAELGEDVQNELLASMLALEQRGPATGRPLVDTLNGSDHANMKELRFKAEDGVWRFAFAFDPERQGVVLCGGDKSGVSEKRFYKALIEKADKRYAKWLKEN